MYQIRCNSLKQVAEIKDFLRKIGKDFEADGYCITVDHATLQLVLAHFGNLYYMNLDEDDDVPCDPQDEIEI